MADKLAAEAAEAARKAEQERQAALVAVVVAPPAPKPVYKAPALVMRTSGGLTGSYGYALPGGNCVNQVPMNKRASGNPISWPILTRSPYIGAAALFSYNHVGMVSGIWGNGDLEIRHENCPGCPTRYPASSFRGFR